VRASPVPSVVRGSFVVKFFVMPNLNFRNDSTGPKDGGATGLQAVLGINFLRFDARSRLCAPRLGTGFAATVSRTPSPRMVEGPINSFHRQVARRPRSAETTESTADEP